MFQMFLAGELHMTLGQLWEALTPAELHLWHIYYQAKAEDRERR
jgi:hypothetical protein